MKCYQCLNIIGTDTINHAYKVTILGNYLKGTRDKVVDFCKSCYDELLERKRRKAKREAFKYRNAREPTQKDIDAQNRADYQAAVI